MECAGNGRARLSPRPVSQPWLVEAIGTAQWTGTSLRDLLAEAGVGEGTVELVFRGADHGVQGEVEHDYARSLPLREATRPEVLLAYEMNGRALEPQHGAPLRLLVPGWYGMTSVKWLTRIEAVTEPFDGYQQAVAYRYQQDADDPGAGVSRMRVRALMIPPGYPDFMTRRRFVEAGAVTLRGRAWSGNGEIARVELGVDGEWHNAELEEPLGEFAWRGWSLRLARGAGRPRDLLPSVRRRRPHAASRAAVELPGDGQQPGADDRRHRALAVAGSSRRPERSPSLCALAAAGDSRGPLALRYPGGLPCGPSRAEARCALTGWGS